MINSRRRLRLFALIVAGFTSVLILPAVTTFPSLIPTEWLSSQVTFLMGNINDIQVEIGHIDEYNSSHEAWGAAKDSPGMHHLEPTQVAKVVHAKGTWIFRGDKEKETVVTVLPCTICIFVVILIWL